MKKMESLYYYISLKNARQLFQDNDYETLVIKSYNENAIDTIDLPQQSE